MPARAPTVRIGALLVTALSLGCQCGDRLVGTEYWLTVDKQGAGQGTVTSEPTGIDCGEACAARFVVNTTVVLTATADGNSNFVGWSGGNCGTDPRCEVVLSTPTLVTAQFEPKQVIIPAVEKVVLTITKQGTGQGLVSTAAAGIHCGSTCTATFDKGTVVQLSAVADASSSFVEWSGACSGASTCTLTLNTDATVTAKFDALPVTGDPVLTVTKTGTGTGQVFTIPSGIDCGATCSSAFPLGTEVELAAVSQSSSVFLGWSGACHGTGLCKVKMDASKNVTAEFAAPTTGPCTWTNRMGGTGVDRMQTVATDAQGNVAVGGVFQYQADFGNGQSVQSLGRDDGFIAFYSPTGVLQWVKRFGATGTDGVGTVAFDAEGNLWVAGYFSGTIDLGDGAMTAQGLMGGDGLIAKYSPSGTLLFSRKLGGPGADTAASLALDSAGNAVVSGVFETSIVIGSKSLSGKGFTDSYVAKFDKNGNVLWAFPHGSAGVDLGLGVAVDKDGDVIQLAVTFMVPFPLPPTPFDFGGGGIYAGGKYDFFVAKFSGATGAHVWSKAFGGAGEDWAWAVATTANKDVVVTGYFQETMAIGSTMLTSKGGDDAYLLRLSGSNGAPLWAKRFGGATPDRARGVAVDAQDNIILAGHFSTTADFGNGPISTVGGADIILAKYSGQGAHLASRHFGGVASWNESWGVTTGTCGALVAGEFKETVDFGTTSMQSRAKEDGFIAVGGP